MISFKFRCRPHTWRAWGFFSDSNIVYSLLYVLSFQINRWSTTYNRRIFDGWEENSNVSHCYLPFHIISLRGYLTGQYIRTVLLWDNLLLRLRWRGSQHDTDCFTHGTCLPPPGNHQRQPGEVLPVLYVFWLDFAKIPNIGHGQYRACPPPPRGGARWMVVAHAQIPGCWWF